MKNDDTVTAQGWPSTVIVLCFLFLTLFLLAQFASAEIIQLKNGNAIETKILRETEEFVVVEAPGGRVKIPKKDIQTIWRGTKEEMMEVRGKEVYFAKGVEMYKDGRFQEAAENFEQARGPGAANAILYANLGSAYASSGEAQKAEENFLKALEKKPNDPDILLNLARFYEVQKDFKSARDYYQKIMILRPDDAGAKRSLAYCEYMTGDYLKAAALYEELGKKNDIVAECNAAAAYIQAGDLDRASAILGQLLESPFSVPRTYLLMAEVSRLRKDHSGAEEYYEKALKHDPDTVKVNVGLGLLYLDMKDWSRAGAAFQAALVKDPGSLEAARGQIQVCVGKEEYQKAIDQYEQLAKKDSSNPAISSSIGLIYLKMNKPKEALEIFQRILARNGQDAKAHTNAGLAYAMMDDADNALEEWTRAVELDPNLEAARKNKKLLEEVMQGARSEKKV